MELGGGDGSILGLIAWNRRRFCDVVEARADLKGPSVGGFRSGGCGESHWLRWALGWVAVFVLIVGSGADVTGVELVSGPAVEAGVDRATIRWQTDVVAGARVQWGTSAGKLDQRAQGPTGTNHQVVLEGLKPGGTYYYSVGTARVVLATNAFVTFRRAAVGEGQSAPVVSVPVTGTGSGGGTASPAARPQAPPTKVTWGSLRTLQDHFDRHGKDFGAKDPDDYARQAWLFLQRGRQEGLPAKRDSDGVLRVYDPATRAFGAYNRDGTTRTYFKPGRRDYFDDQPGQPVNLKEGR